MDCHGASPPSLHQYHDLLAHLSLLQLQPRRSPTYHTVFSQMSSVRYHAQDVSMSVDGPGAVETLPGHCHDPCAGEDHDSIERESLSQPLANVSQDMCPVVTGVEPQVCPALLVFKSPADTVSEECSQVPTSSTQMAPSPQPSPEFLASLGIKVRDFAYQNTLPAIAPVPRVPRQVQPAPKRAQRDWDDAGPSSSLQIGSGQTRSKKPRSLERQPTEPLQEPVIRHTRALERMSVKRLYSIITPSPRTLASPSRVRPSASPPTSPLTPPLSHLESQESDVVHTPSAFPFAVHVDDTSMIPASRLDSALQPVSFHPVLYTRISLGSLSFPTGSTVPVPPQVVPPALMSPFLEVPSESKESETGPRARKRRTRGTVETTAPSNRYQLRQRPTPSSRASSISRCSHEASHASKTLPRRTRRVR